MKRLTICLAAAMLAFAGCDTTPHVAPNGNDSVTCGSTAPFRTFARAYQCAQDPAVVTVEPGIYGPQTIPAGSKQVVFTAPQGATVRATSDTSGPGYPATLQIEGSNVQVNGLTVDSNGFRRKAIHSNGDRVRLKNMDVGNTTDDKAIEAWGTDTRIENSTIHDARTIGPGSHLECLFAVGAERLHVTGSTFRDCAIYDISLTLCDWCGSPQPLWGNGVIENNRFFHSNQGDPGSWHYAELAEYGPLYGSAGWTIRNNWFETRSPGNPGGGGIDWGPWSGGVRCGNTESPGVNQLDAVWTQPC